MKSTAGYSTEDMREIQPFLIVGLAGIATGLPFVIPFLWPLAFVAPVPLLYSIRRPDISGRRTALLGFIFGTAMSGVALLWLWQALPLDWLVESRVVGVYLTAVSWLFASCALGVGTAVFALLARALTTQRAFDAVFFPFAWIIGEEARMWAYAVLTLAPNSLFGPHFSFGALGYALTQSHLLLQVADPGGVRSLSFFAIAIASALTVCVQKNTTKKRCIIALCTCVFMGATLIPATLREQTITTLPFVTKNVILITTTIPIAGPRIRSNEPYESFLKQAARTSTSSNIIIFPEGFGFAGMFSNEETRNAFVTKNFKNNPALIISTMLAQHPHGTYTPEIQYYDTMSHTIIARAEKIFLIPEGESVPYLAQFFSTPFMSTALQKHSTQDAQLEPGTAVTAAAYDSIRIGSLFCGEVSSPELYTKLVQATHPNVLVNLASQAWFNNSHILYAQTRAMAQVHAVQHRLPFVAAANGSPSYAIDAAGNIQQEMPWGEEGVMVVPVQVRK